MPPQTIAFIGLMILIPIFVAWLVGGDKEAKKRKKMLRDSARAAGKNPAASDS